MPVDPHKTTKFTAIEADHYEGLPSVGGGGGESEAATGEVFYVCNATTGLPVGGVTGADVSGAGKDPLVPFSTIDYAIGQCTASRGDKIIVMPGHSETLTSAITLDVAGVTIEGHGAGTNRPQITNGSTGDAITVTAANCKIQNLYFNESTAAMTADINVAAALVTIADCHFDLGATDLEAITWASGQGLKVVGNTFQVTANGPDAAIEIEATGCDNGLIVSNLFHGDSVTNQWDAAAINSTVAHTNLTVDKNVFVYGPALIVATSVSSSIGLGNQFLHGTSTAAAPQVWYCDLGSTIRDGKSPETPTTLNDAVVTKATEGDTVYVLAGSSATLTAAQAFSVAGVSVIGLGNGANRPAITVNGTVDGFNVTAANVKIKNFLFNEADLAATASINVAAADVSIEDCQFDMGANDAAGAITWASGARLTIKGCVARVTADGPDQFLDIQGANDGLLMEDCLLDGGSAANVWDDGAIDYGSNAATDCVVRNCLFHYGTAFAGAGNTSLYTVGNSYHALAIPKAGIPLTLYADPSGSTTSDGTNPDDPTTLVNAIASATAGAKILIYPGSYTLTAAQALDVANLLLQPVDYIPKSQRVTITTATADINLFDITAAGVTIRGIRFTNTGTLTGQTEMIDINSGGDQATIIDCFFDLADTANAEGINIATGVSDVRIIDCTFVDPNAGESCVLNAGAQTEISGCRFDLAGGDGLAIEELATPGTGAWYHHNVFSGDGTDQTFMSWTADPSVGAAVHHNVVTEAGTTNNWLGDDTDLDTVVVECYAAGGAAGATTVINPSVS